MIWYPKILVKWRWGYLLSGVWDFLFGKKRQDKIRPFRMLTKFRSQLPQIIWQCSKWYTFLNYQRLNSQVHFEIFLHQGACLMSFAYIYVFFPANWWGSRDYVNDSLTSVAFFASFLWRLAIPIHHLNAASNPAEVKTLAFEYSYPKRRMGNCLLRTTEAPWCPRLNNYHKLSKPSPLLPKRLQREPLKHCLSKSMA